MLPYDRRLHRFPAYLQQLEMESNGKSVTRDGAPVDYATGNVVWGEPGNNAQHSFFQLLHQGTARVALDFIAPVNGSSRFLPQQDLALANCFAQAEAFAFGQTAEPGAGRPAGQGRCRRPEIERLVPHKVHAGNRPSSLILLPRLGPRALGKLIAWYEHKVFVQSVIWDINPFDQWGVELGKKLASFDERAGAHRALARRVRRTCRSCWRRCSAGARTDPCIAKNRAGTIRMNA